MNVFLLVFDLIFCEGGFIFFFVLSGVFTKRISAAFSQVRADGKIPNLIKDDTNAWNFLGVMYFRRNEIGRAIDCFNNAIKLNKKNIDAWNNLGIIQGYMRNFKDAMYFFQQALKIKKTYASTWNNIGMVHDRLGNFNAAIGCYTKALEIDSKHGISWLNIGIAHFNEKRYEDALNCCKRAIELKPLDAFVKTILKTISEKIALESGRLSKDRDMAVKILEFESEHHRLMTRTEMVQQLNIDMDMVQYLVDLLNNPAEYSRTELKNLEAVASSLIKQCPRPSLLDIFRLTTLNVQDAKKIGKYLVDNGFVKSIMRVPAVAAQEQSISSSISKSPIIPYDGPAPYFFVVFSSRDRERVIPIIKHLQENDVKIWYETGNVPVAARKEIVQEKIAKCTSVIIFLSPSAINQINVRDEINQVEARYKNGEIHIFPIYLDKFILPDALQLLFGPIQAVFKLDYSEQEFLKRIVQAFKGKRDEMEEYIEEIDRKFASWGSSEKEKDSKI
nr:tetratricopeptide repeat protein [Candidatus Sigynarchaeota archaeon]